MELLSLKLAQKGTHRKRKLTIEVKGRKEKELKVVGWLVGR